MGFLLRPASAPTAAAHTCLPTDGVLAQAQAPQPPLAHHAPPAQRLNACSVQIAAAHVEVQAMGCAHEQGDQQVHSLWGGEGLWVGGHVENAQAGGVGGLVVWSGCVRVRCMS